MGYTHYWDTSRCDEQDILGFQQALPVIQDVINRNCRLLCCEFNQPRKRPVVSVNEIRFNGKGENGHETFLFALNGQWEFCKTARKPYDLAVCECLLVLNAFLPHLSIDSDGFCGVLAEQKHGVRLDESWDQAIENVKRYGVHYHAVITRRREPYCDLGLVLDRAAKAVSV